MQGFSNDPLHRTFGMAPPPRPPGGARWQLPVHRLYCRPLRRCGASAVIRETLFLADHRYPERAAGSGGNATYTIFLRDFAATVAEQGRDGRRPVRISIELAVLHPGAGFPDDITAVMSYENIVQELRDLCAGTPVTGPEDLAERAAALCLTRGQVRHAAVSVEIGEGGGGVAIHRDAPRRG